MCLYKAACSSAANCAAQIISTGTPSIWGCCGMNMFKFSLFEKVMMVYRLLLTLNTTAGTLQFWHRHASCLQHM